VERPPSKAWKVPIEVVIEMSLASTTNMDLDEDLKKWSRMNKNKTSMPTATDKELPE